MATSIMQKLLNYRELDSSHDGIITIPLIKVKIVWGVVRADTFTYVASGLYHRTIDLTSHGFTGNLSAITTARYGQGLPTVGIAALTTTSIGLACNVNLNTVYVHYFVIGSYT